MSTFLNLQSSGRESLNPFARGVKSLIPRLHGAGQSSALVTTQLLWGPSIPWFGSVLISVKATDSSGKGGFRRKNRDCSRDLGWQQGPGCSPHIALLDFIIWAKCCTDLQWWYPLQTLEEAYRPKMKCHHLILAWGLAVQGPVVHCVPWGLGGRF
jgi:hypothetical protein